MMRIFSFLFGLLLLALVFAGSVPRSLKDAFKSVLAPAAYHRPGPGVSLPGVPEKVDPELGSQEVPAGMGATGAVDPEIEPVVPPVPIRDKPVFRERAGAINQDLFQPDIPRLRK
jgi:hypothetical protein